jgi:hypothetical protein
MKTILEIRSPACYALAAALLLYLVIGVTAVRCDACAAQATPPSSECR